MQQTAAQPHLIQVVQVPCPLWHGLDALDGAWRQVEVVLGADLCACADHAVTMTGELADCFTDRAEGVGKILQAVAQRLQKPFRVYAGDGGFFAADIAKRHVERVASANWHATAACLGERLGTGVLMDVGSTTTDVVPYVASGAATRARSDAERLLAGELVYIGVVRTPVMALADEDGAVQVKGEPLPVVAELFATTADVYRVLGRLPEGADQYPACDGAEKTPAASARRLARMFGCDVADADDWMPHARALAGCQLRRIETAYRKVCAGRRIAADAPIVGAGTGRFLARDLARNVARPYVDFADLFSADPRAADCAAAVSIAWLAGR